MKKYRFVCVVGPSGAGKTTLITGSKNPVINGLVDLYPDEYHFSISTTTRSIRDGEEPNVDYFFEEKEKILNHADDYLEITEYGGNFYALRLNQALVDGKTAITPIEPIGLQKYLDKRDKINKEAGYEKLTIDIVYLNASEELCKRNMLRSRSVEVVNERLAVEDIRERWSAFLEANPGIKYHQLTDKDLNENVALTVHSKLASS